MKKNVIQISEKQLHKIITEAVMNELNYQTIANAEGASESYHDDTHTISCIEHLKSYFEDILFDKNKPFGYEKSIIGQQIRGFIDALDDMKAFMDRKENQYYNFNDRRMDLSDEAEREIAKVLNINPNNTNVMKTLWRLSDEEQEKVYNQVSPKTQEYIDGQ